MAKVTARFYESEKMVGVCRNSRWLIEAYVRAYANRYGDQLRVRYYSSEK